MLRKDSKALFQRELVREGAIFRKRTVTYYRFVSGKYRAQSALPEDEFMALCRHKDAVPVMQADELRRVWWLFQGDIYWEDDRLSQEEVTALLVEKALLKDRRVQRAMDRAAAGRLGQSRSRSAIPDDVKVAVWRRDGGRCVRCGSQENLEYDHVIPHSKGGSDSERNLQLLCQACNRAKGANLT